MNNKAKISIHKILPHQEPAFDAYQNMIELRRSPLRKPHN